MFAQRVCEHVTGICCFIEIIKAEDYVCPSLRDSLEIGWHMIIDSKTKPKEGDIVAYGVNGRLFLIPHYKSVKEVTVTPFDSKCGPTLTFSHTNPYLNFLGLSRGEYPAEPRSGRCY